jgi:cytochrome b561
VSAAYPQEPRAEQSLETAGHDPRHAATARYTGIAIALHWIIAALIGVNIALVLLIDRWPENWVRPAIDLHKSIGMTVLGLAALRVLWRLGHKPPALPVGYQKIEINAAHLAHIALYALMVAIPLSGYLHDSAWKNGPTHPDRLFWLVPWPRFGMLASLSPAAKEHAHGILFDVHQWLAYGLYALVGLHVAAALKHQWVDGHRELQRMLPARREKKLDETGDRLPTGDASKT